MASDRVLNGPAQPVIGSAGPLPLQEGIMGIIVIKDLQEDVELDRQAMLAISGGSRFRTGAAGARRDALRGNRLVNFAPKAAPKRPPSK
jgi:hypothetical protein